MPRETASDRACFAPGERIRGVLRAVLSQPRMPGSGRAKSAAIRRDPGSLSALSLRPPACRGKVLSPAVINGGTFSR